LKRVDQISDAIILILTVMYLLEASKLPIWKGTTFGSGLFPLIIGITLVPVSTLSLFKRDSFVPVDTESRVFQKVH
jgi:hypothetical protein